MFALKIEDVFTKERLSNAFEDISSTSKGIDEVSYSAFKTEFRKNIKQIKEDILKGLYAPEPLKKIEIDKPNSDEKRPIALSAIKDKVVQKALYLAINPYFDEQFSDKSYAYRPQKSTLKAINRVTQFLNEKNLIVVKTDIDNFFETIDHDILLATLEKSVADKRVVRLISLFIQTGLFHDTNYKDHTDGVHQGAILSPLLSNIYLNEMDKYLESRKVPFVRYADDFVLLFKNHNDAKVETDLLKEFLASLKLSLEETKTSVVHISEGFSFLGVRFEGRNRHVENENLQKSISKIHKLSKNKSGFLKYVQEVNTYLHGLKNYYLKIISHNAMQHRLLQEALIESVAHKVFLAKDSKTITTKKEFKVLLEQIKFELLFDMETLQTQKDLVLAKGYEKYLAKKSYKDTSTKLDKKRNAYAKKFANDATLHIATPGLMLGVSKNKFVVKKYGKVQRSFPLTTIKRVVFEGKGYSLSTNVIKKCADNGVSIDFISRDATSYASLVTYKASVTQTINKQAQVINTPLQLELAKAFIKGKAKNQVNYIKYLNKYHKMLDKQIDTIELNIVKMKGSQSISELMGYEGSISASYWKALKLVLEVPFPQRVTYGAKDIVNSSLNYAYAFLYGRVQHALVHAGLSLNISFLHALDEQKPTLTFDMIEEFRTFIVDRTIISMLNKDEPIKLGSDGMLTKASRQLIAKNIKEKLGSYTMWKKESIKVENIIQTQAYKLAKVVSGDLKSYKPFIGKF